MPKQKRWAVKQKMTQALLAVDKAQTHLILVGREYETIHPDYYQAFSHIVTSLEQVKDSITDLQELI